jgi:hypothetical protein
LGLVAAFCDTSGMQPINLSNSMCSLKSFICCCCCSVDKP